MKSSTSFARNEVFMALPIFYGYSPTSLKYAWHHLSPGGIFLYFASLNHIIALKFEPHHLPSEWCRFTSCLWNLNDVNFLQNDDRLYIWSRCCIISSLWACSSNVKIFDGMFDIFKVFAAYSGIFKGLVSFFPHLQGFVGIFLHLQSLGRDSLHLWRLVGISKILMSSYSTIHPRCLSYVASENLC